MTASKASTPQSVAVSGRLTSPSFAVRVTPLVEIAVFIQVGERIGLWPTLAVVILTAVIGTALLRAQGLATLRRAQESLEQQAFPINEVFDGACLLFAGALLLTPGFVTDGVGFLLFVPAFRGLIRKMLAQYLVRSGRIFVSAHGTGSRNGEPGEGRRDGDVIDGEFTDITPAAGDLPPKRDGTSPWSRK